MYYEIGNKLYVLKDEKTLVGVDMTPQVLLVEGTELKADNLAEYTQLTPSEARARYNVTEETPYTFPVERKAKEEVKKTRATSK